ncbi:hypothetical protein RCO27_18325 [Sphingosinicella sp. LHD-64]|nr:hypothetical protein [Sphingosinicella sp. LHD-64]MDQ8758188.1 hypothetical protein [Sphingosinicella sp. LHD-64]
MTSRTYPKSGFTAALRRVLADLYLGLSRLNRMQYAAPWRPERARD